MPLTVPEYGPSKVNREGVPGVRIQPASNVDEAFGGGASSAAVGTASRDLNTVTSRLYAQQQQAADEVAVQEADLQAGLLANKLHVESQKLQGKDALGTLDYIDKEWGAGTEKINAGLSNDNQRAMVSKRLGARYVSLNGTAQVHIANQMKKYDTETTNAYIENAQNSAILNYTNPDQVALSLFQQEQAMFQFAKRNGLSDDAIKASFTEIKNKTHMGVVNRMLADNQIDMAKDYYERNKKFMIGDDANRVAGFIEKETMLAVASENADRIIKAGETDPTKILMELDKINDKNLRAATKAEYEAKIQQMTVAYNQNEAGVGARIASGQYRNPYDLEADRANITDEFYKVASESFAVKFQSMGTKSKRADTYTSLVERFGGLSDSDIYSKSKKYADFRKDVISKKGYLKPEQYNKLLLWTDPNFVQQNVEPKQNGIMAGIKFMADFFKKGTPSGIAAQIMDAVTTKAMDPSVKSEDVPSVFRAGLREEAYRRDPNAMNLAEPSNYTFSEGNVNLIYPAKSDAKNDTSITEETVNVIRRSDGQRGTIPRKKFDNERYKLA